jgi:uncharacterized protein
MTIEDEQLATVRHIYETFLGGAVSAVARLMAEDIELLPPVHAGPTAVPGWGRVWRGRDEVAEYLGIIATTLEFEAFEADEFIVAPGRVVVLGHERCRVRATGRLVEAEWAQVFTFRGRDVIRHREYSSTAAWEAGWAGAPR